MGPGRDRTRDPLDLQSDIQRLLSIKMHYKKFQSISYIHFKGNQFKHIYKRLQIFQSDRLLAIGRNGYGPKMLLAEVN